MCTNLMILCVSVTTIDSGGTPAGFTCVFPAEYQLVWRSLKYKENNINWLLILLLLLSFPWPEAGTLAVTPTLRLGHQDRQSEPDITTGPGLAPLLLLLLLLFLALLLLAIESFSCSCFYCCSLNCSYCLFNSYPASASTVTPWTPPTGYWIHLLPLLLLLLLGLLLLCIQFLSCSWFYCYSLDWSYCRFNSSPTPAPTATPWTAPTGYWFHLLFLLLLLLHELLLLAVDSISCSCFSSCYFSFSCPCPPASPSCRPPWRPPAPTFPIEAWWAWFPWVG